RGFTYRYPDASAPALAELTLDVEPGSFVVLAGDSGAGKSTLLRAACGLVPHFHGGEAAGEIEVGGLDVRGAGPSELSAVCGAVFQDPESQVVMGSVRAELALALEHSGAPPAAVARGVEEVALALGIADLLDRQVDTLSGGELQRVSIAAALVARPALLVLDEPTSQLDPVAGDELVWLLRRLNEQWGTAVLLAEHRLERCLPAADRVVALDGGRVAFDGAPADFLDWAVESRPVLATPLARLFSTAGLGPLPVSVREARRRLRDAGLLPADSGTISSTILDSPCWAGVGQDGAEAGRGRRIRRRASAALELRNAWYEIPDGPAVLRGIDLRVGPGERVALMGRNGAGKSTLLRLARGLIEPTRGRAEHGGEVALLMQNPGDYLFHEHADEEVGQGGLEIAGLAGRGRANPRDLSGGERQRLALEIVLGGGRPAVVCLDEPTRGMDRAWRAGLVRRLRDLAGAGAAVLVATHDGELAAELAERVVLLGRGEVIADGAAAEVLAGGWYFTTDVARALDGAAGALTSEEGARLIERELVR
ncbi:MAG: ATP-binding cassette domain-containing protein, partial [Actinobacteria bacterium]|nr:ATP-binding cassette domain-containing protein [Actinomycetota bacterium]